MDVDVDGFNNAMSEQKAKARAAWVGSGEVADEGIWFDIADKHGTTDFLGYDTHTSEGQILALLQDGNIVNKVSEGDDVMVVLNPHSQRRARPHTHGCCVAQLGASRWASWRTVIVCACAYAHACVRTRRACTCECRGVGVGRHVCRP